MAADGTGSLLFTDDVTGRGSKMSSEVCRAKLCSHSAEIKTF